VSGDSLPPAYFDELYAEHPDPWDFTGRWYERRKRAITMASLPRQRFRRAFEPGCSIGLLTHLLAERCEELLAADVSDFAVAAARNRVAERAGVQVVQLAIPDQWPAGRFDLVVLSEVAYYCDAAGAERLGRRARDALTDDGVLVLCHWLPEVADYPLSGEVAQRIVREASGLERLASHREADFVLEVLVPAGSPSVATVEGLTPGASPDTGAAGVDAP